MRSLRIEIVMSGNCKYALLDRLHAEPEDRNITPKADAVTSVDRLHAEPEDRNSEIDTDMNSNGTTGSMRSLRIEIIKIH